jgi:hypothetical protein
MLGTLPPCPLHGMDLKHSDKFTFMFPSDRTAQSVKWLTVGWTAGVQFPGGAGISLFTTTLEQLWGWPSLLSSHYQDLFLQWQKQLKCETDHSPQCIVKVWDVWSFNSTPTMRDHGMVLRYRGHLICNSQKYCLFWNL